MSTEAPATAEGVEAKLKEKLAATIAVITRVSALQRDSSAVLGVTPLESCLGAGGHRYVRRVSTACAEASKRSKPSPRTVTTVCCRCGASFSVSIVSPQFEGKSLLARHRLVSQVLMSTYQSIRRVASSASFHRLQQQSNCVHLVELCNA